MVEQLRHDDMRPAHQPHPVIGRGRGAVQHVEHRRPGSVDQTAPGEAIGAPAFTRRLDHPQAVLDAHQVGVHPRADPRPPVGRVARVEQHQPRIVDPAVRIFEAMHILRLERRARRVPPQVDRARRGKLSAPADMVVEEQAEPQQPARAQPVAIGQHEAQRPDDVRRDAPQYLAFLQRLAHQAEFIMLQIAQPAVDQLGRGRRGALRKVPRLQQQHPRAAPGRIARDPGAVDPAADHDDIIGRRHGVGHASGLRGDGGRVEPFSTLLFRGDYVFCKRAGAGLRAEGDCRYV